MGTVRVLTTGGTIATRTDANGNTIARASGADLVSGLVVEGVRIEVEDVFRLGSFRMTGLPQLVGIFGSGRGHWCRSAACGGARNTNLCRHTICGVSLDGACLVGLSGGHVLAGDAADEPGRVGCVLSAVGPQRAAPGDR